MALYLLYVTGYFKPSKDMFQDKMKLPRFSDCLSEKQPDQIVDDGHIPGDKRGVAGIDSIFWR